LLKTNVEYLDHLKMLHVGEKVLT